METNLVVEGFKIMLLGMGTVYLFLTILMWLMKAMSSLLAKLYPEPCHLETNNKQQIDNSKVVAAIVAAIKHHRG